MRAGDLNGGVQSGETKGETRERGTEQLAGGSTPESVGLVSCTMGVKLVWAARVRAGLLGLVLG